MLLQAHFEVSHNYLEQNNADCYLLKWKKCPTYIVKLKKKSLQGAEYSDWYDLNHLKKIIVYVNEIYVYDMYDKHMSLYISIYLYMTMKS